MFLLSIPENARAANIERFYLEIAVAPPHNEVVGVRDVARYMTSLDLRFSLAESKNGLGILGAELMPNYYWGGHWPEQTNKWSAGDIQRLEIKYRVFIRPLKWLEF